MTPHTLRYGSIDAEAAETRFPFGRILTRLDGPGVMRRLFAWSARTFVAVVRRRG